MIQTNTIVPGEHEISVVLLVTRQTTNSQTQMTCAIRLPYKVTLLQFISGALIQACHGCSSPFYEFLEIKVNL